MTGLTDIGRTRPSQIEPDQGGFRRAAAGTRMEEKLGTSGKFPRRDTPMGNSSSRQGTPESGNGSRARIWDHAKA
ncbi:unnamed protein product [Linum trigynum]|uniref:Uncharacterized protein n=1 Tax=Linum trigynum TaxID=586398 RepID=A0AAV2F6N2_9ROSI